MSLCGLKGVGVNIGADVGVGAGMGVVLVLVWVLCLASVRWMPPSEPSLMVGRSMKAPGWYGTFSSCTC